MVWFADARMPEGVRVYAVGDIHGCHRALCDLHRAIEADLAARPVADWRIIYLGDYVDRGPSSRDVIDFLIGRMAEEPRILCLRGNHDEMFLSELDGNARSREVWLTNGGGETLKSYDMLLGDYIDGLRNGRTARDIVPETHRDFLGGLRNSARFGDYYFVHAGIDPDQPLDRQKQEAQLWIRGSFLGSRQEFEAVVIHGHTPVEKADVRPNRIGIDTGAVFGGDLTCLVLEEDRKEVLTEAGVTPLPEPEAYRGALPPTGDSERQEGKLGRILRRLRGGG